MSDSIEMGRLGEQFVLDYFHSQQIESRFSNDKFDRERDIILSLDGKDVANVEVKTMVPFVTKRAFTVRQSQLNKLLNADFVVFVSVPNDQLSSETDGKVYIMKGTDFRVRTEVTRDGRKMLLIDFDNPGLKHLFDLSEDQIAQLKKHSLSSWN